MRGDVRLAQKPTKNNNKVSMKFLGVFCQKVMEPPKSLIYVPELPDSEHSITKPLESKQDGQRYITEQSICDMILLPLSRSLKFRLNQNFC